MLENYVEKQLRLLSMERECEIREEEEMLSKYSHSELQKRGLALLNLTKSSLRTGLGGKMIVEFQHHQNPLLPSNSFSNGDAVNILSSSGQEEKEKTTGIVFRVNDYKISIVFKEDLFEAERYKM